MMRMVHKLHSNKHNSKASSHTVQREIREELQRAHEIVDSMRKEWGITWKTIEEKTLKIATSWDDVGPTMDLAFLGRFCNIR
jgi:hypothetical protein